MIQEKYLTFNEFTDLLNDDEIYYKYYEYRKENREPYETYFDFYDRKIGYINQTFVPNFTQTVPIELKFDSEQSLNQIVEQIINELDDYARNEDQYEYGLPIGNKDMKQIVTNILIKHKTT
jgi:hypothetical protein